MSKDNELNFIGILRKNLSKDQLENYSLFDDKNFLSSILSNLSNQIDQNILNNLKNIKCFPIFVSEEIYKPKQKNIFLIGDAFFTFLPTFAQGASQSIESSKELYDQIKNNRDSYYKKRMKKLKFHTLPVIQEGELVGMITIKDILSFNPEIYPELDEFARIREEAGKLKRIKKAKNRASIPEGICEECGSQDILHRVNGMLICESCKDSV